MRLTPSRVRIVCDTSRPLRAEGVDPAGRTIENGLDFEWTVDARVGALTVSDSASSCAIFTAGSEPAEGVISVVAHCGGLTALGEVPVEVLDEIIAGRSGEGIPEPEFVNQPGAPWRSRMLEERWQINAGHRDYRAVADRPTLKLRYLAMLFAKEIVVRSHQDPRLEKPLEQMAEIISYADQRLAARGRTRRGDPPRAPGNE